MQILGQFLGTVITFNYDRKELWLYAWMYVDIKGYIFYNLTLNSFT